MKQFKIVRIDHTQFSPSTVIEHKTLAIPVRESATATSHGKKTSWQTLSILLVNILFMLLTPVHAVETDDSESDAEELIEIRAGFIQDWCQAAAQAKDEGELNAIEFQLDNARGRQIKAMKPIYEEWQRNRAKVVQQKAKVQELMAQVSAERKKLDEGSRIPTPKEKELEAALDGVKREIMELSGFMRKVYDLNTALEASQRAGSVGRFDDRSLEELQAQLGRARSEVASYEREHGDILALNQQLATFLNELESVRLSANVPNASRLKDLERQVDQATQALNDTMVTERLNRRSVQRMIAGNLAIEEILKWISVCIDGRRQQLAARAKPPQTDLTPSTACMTRQGPFGCAGVFYGGNFKMSCHNLKDNTNTPHEGEAVFRFNPDGTVDVLFFVPNFKDGQSAGKLGAGKITSSGSVEVNNYMSGDEMASWKGQFTLQPMAGGKIGPVGKGTLKLVYQLGDAVPPHAVCEGEFSLPAKKE